MLSRFALKAAKPRMLAIRAASTTPVNNAVAVPDKPDGFDIFENEKNPERDHVNFPRRKRPIEIGPVRHFAFPEEWFQFFYPKTGVTGPYVFAASLTCYLTSKEIWVLEHEFYTGLALLVAVSIIVKKTSPFVNEYVNKEMDAEEAELDSIRQKEIDRCKDAIADEEKAQWMGTSYQELIEAKKENVALQLEVEYRARLKEAFTQVKKRLDYQLQTANVIRSHEQRHMVDWIINNVKKSITPKQEEDALKKCVADLKALAK